MAYTTYGLKNFTDSNGNIYPDIYLDNQGNIATVQDIDAIIQTCKTEMSLWLGEYIYNSGIGVNYPAILGQKINEPFLYSEIKNALLRVTGVLGITNIRYKWQLEIRKLEVTVFVKLSAGVFSVTVGV